MDERPFTHLLVVEDDESLRRVVVRALERKGYRITAPKNFEAAIAVVEQDEPVDLLIADVSLWPGQPQGIALGNMAQLRRRGLKVLYISGAYDVHWAASFGDAAAVLQKPFTPEALCTAVRAVLDPLAHRRD